MIGIIVDNSNPINVTSRHFSLCSETDEPKTHVGSVIGNRHREIEGENRAGDGLIGTRIYA